MASFKARLGTKYFLRNLFRVIGLVSLSDNQVNIALFSYEFPGTSDHEG